MFMKFSFMFFQRIPVLLATGTLVLVLSNLAVARPAVEVSSGSTKPTWARSLDETLNVINSKLLGKTIDCKMFSQEATDRLTAAMRAEEIRVCGAWKEGERNKPEGESRRHCYQKIYQSFDRHPYYEGLSWSPYVYA